MSLDERVRALEARATEPVPEVDPDGVVLWPSIAAHRIDLDPAVCWSCAGPAGAFASVCAACRIAAERAGVLPALLVACEPWPVAPSVSTAPTVPAPRDAQAIADAIGGRVVGVTAEGEPLAQEDF